MIYPTNGWLQASDSPKSSRKPESIVHRNKVSQGRQGTREAHSRSRVSNDGWSSYYLYQYSTYCTVPCRVWIHHPAAANSWDRRCGSREPPAACHAQRAVSHKEQHPRASVFSKSDRGSLGLDERSGEPMTRTRNRPATALELSGLAGPSASTLFRKNHQPNVASRKNIGTGCASLPGLGTGLPCRPLLSKVPWPRACRGPVL
ncbi:uncharacterized protein EI97DRAFT_53903 [Westerdykella ornata]|uniref:Uncharacterized protein n=1 Tax=Westerdykella ornata TaxID=318751 RepID=A0A6A6JJW0_WESOR|nr:uncharacterized protein EI97DRAFT_53903 [Westerdykella ornata]KAF2276268.1 hypothetical protein EI97DRAFT_53903 [Westerdykella ornata]